MLKALVEKAIKLITETVPNFFRKLFGKDPKYKNDPRVKDINGDCKDLEECTNRGRQILKAAGIIIGGAAAGAAAGRLISKTNFGKSIGKKINDYQNDIKYVSQTDSEGKKTYYKRNVTTDENGNEQFDFEETSKLRYDIDNLAHKIVDKMTDIGGKANAVFDKAEDTFKKGGAKFKDVVTGPFRKDKPTPQKQPKPIF